MIKAIDGTSIDIERLEEAQRKIDLYRKTKEDNIFDSFYRSDLAVFETGIEMMKNALKEEQYSECALCFPPAAALTHMVSIETMIKNLRNIEYDIDNYRRTINVKCHSNKIVEMFKDMADCDMFELVIDGKTYNED